MRPPDDSTRSWECCGARSRTGPRGAKDNKQDLGEAGRRPPPGLGRRRVGRIGSKRRGAHRWDTAGQIGPCRRVLVSAGQRVDRPGYTGSSQASSALNGSPLRLSRRSAASGGSGTIRSSGPGRAHACAAIPDPRSTTPPTTSLRHDRRCGCEIEELRSQSLRGGARAHRFVGRHRGEFIAHDRPRVRGSKSSVVSDRSPGQCRSMCK